MLHQTRRSVLSYFHARCKLYLQVIAINTDIKNSRNVEKVLKQTILCKEWSHTIDRLNFNVDLKFIPGTTKIDGNSRYAINITMQIEMVMPKLMVLFVIREV